ncbi:MAG: glycosyltransferase family 39 protein [Planctomycetes bacterium]|nr:glycosyltransferase family 39 protein [Planctomycetota bacterium]
MTNQIQPEQNLTASVSDNGGIFSRAGWQYLLVPCIAGLLMFFRLGTAAFSGHECHIALVARTMLDDEAWLSEQYYPENRPAATELNRWLIPVENGLARLNKTPLAYWCAADLAQTGIGLNEWSVRGVSGISAIITAIVVLAFGRRILPARAAFFGVLLLVSSFGMVKFGRKGLPEMLTCMFITSAMASFYMGINARRMRWHIGWMAVFWVCMGLANLTKQVFPMLMFWPLAAYVLWRAREQAGDGNSMRSLKLFFIVLAIGVAAYTAASYIAVLRDLAIKHIDVLRSIKKLAAAAAFLLPLVLLGWSRASVRSCLKLLPTAIPGAIVMLLLFVPWIWYVGQAFGPKSLDEIYYQTVSRGMGVGKWIFSPPYKYLEYICTLTLPWTPLLIPTVAMPWMKRFVEHRGGLVFLFIWVAGLLAVLVGAAEKREHYLLPALPAICLLMGFAVDDLVGNWRLLPQKLAKACGMIGPVIAAAAVAVLLTIWFVRGHEARWLHLAIVSGGAAAALVCSAVFAGRGRYVGGMAMMIAAMVIFCLGFFAGHEFWDDNAAMRQFARQAGRTVPAGQQACAWGRNDEIMVWYFGRDLPCKMWQAARPQDDSDDDTTGHTLISNKSGGIDLKSIKWMLSIQDKGAEGWIGREIENLGFQPAMQRIEDKINKRSYMLYEKRD